MESILAELAARVGGTMVPIASLDGSEEFGAPSLRGMLDGHRFTVALFDVPGPPDHFTVVVEAVIPFTLTLHKEGRWDWLRKAMGQLEDYEVGLVEIDREFIVGGQPRQTVVTYLQHPEVQKCLHEISGFHSLGADHGLMRATFPTTETWTADDILRIATCLVRMARLAEES